MIGAGGGVALARVGDAVLATMAARRFPDCLTAPRCDGVWFTAASRSRPHGVWPFPAFQGARVAARRVESGGQATTAERGPGVFAGSWSRRKSRFRGPPRGRGSPRPELHAAAGGRPRVHRSGVLTFRVLCRGAILEARPDSGFLPRGAEPRGRAARRHAVGAGDGFPCRERADPGQRGSTTPRSTTIKAHRKPIIAPCRPATSRPWGCGSSVGGCSPIATTITGQPVAIIDERIARTYWPDEDAVGKRVNRGGRQNPRPG